MCSAQLPYFFFAPFFGFLVSFFFAIAPPFSRCEVLSFSTSSGCGQRDAPYIRTLLQSVIHVTGLRDPSRI